MGNEMCIMPYNAISRPNITMLNCCIDVENFSIQIKEISMWQRFIVKWIAIIIHFILFDVHSYLRFEFLKLHSKNIINIDLKWHTLLKEIHKDLLHCKKLDQKHHKSVGEPYTLEMQFR